MAEVVQFVVDASRLSGVLRIALIGSLTTDKADPKDADLLVTVDDDASLVPLARLSRRIQGRAQSIGRGGEVFLSDTDHGYIGRVCPWRECGAGIRMSCDALNCGRRPYLHDDLATIELDEVLVREPPVELWPEVKVRRAIPTDLEKEVLAQLRGRTSV
jgi:hypothetical protein